MMQILARPFSRIISFFDSREGSNLYNYRKLSVAGRKNMFWQAGFIFSWGVSLVVAKRNNTKVFDPVIAFVPVDMVNAHVIRDVSMMPDPDQTMQQSASRYLAAIYRHFTVWTSRRPVVASYFCAPPAKAFTPSLPEKFAVISIMKCIAKILSGRKCNSFNQLNSPYVLAVIANI